MKLQNLLKKQIPSKLIELGYSRNAHSPIRIGKLKPVNQRCYDRPLTLIVADLMNRNALDVYAVSDANVLAYGLNSHF